VSLGDEPSKASQSLERLEASGYDRAMPTDALQPLPATPIGRYRHYKGNFYDVVGVVRHSETLEPLVLYRALYGESGLWVRPYAMFFGEVEVDGLRQPRFAFVGAQLPGRMPGASV
jgi:hypothetical protein